MGKRVREPGDTPATRRWRTAGLAAGGVLALAGLAVPAWWLFTTGQEARQVAARMQADGRLLRGQLADYRLTEAGPTLARLRENSARAHELTDDPVWAIASRIPFAGRDLRAARETSAALAEVTTAARPLEAALPRLDPGSGKGAGRVDVAALVEVAGAVPELSRAVSAASARMAPLDPAKLRPSVASGVVTVDELFSTVRGPLRSAAPLTRVLPGMLGAQGRRTWIVLLQQNAEARGTGGLVGAYAVVRADGGRLRLTAAESRAVLDRGPAIPAAAAPEELRDLWGRDLQEWAGLNLSPNFPWTGQLVAAGWAADPQRGTADYVAAVDPHVVAALLAGTGPVTVRGVRVDAGNAVEFLHRGVYRRFRDPQLVDAVTQDLVTKVFARFTAGRMDLPALVEAIREPVSQRRLLLWSADRTEQQVLRDLPVGGALPGTPGAYAMAVVNNGGGNKLDAYLKVHTTYRPGVCAQGSRVGHVLVDLHNTAPRRGLPDYVSVRSDLLEEAGPGARYTAGSNRVLLDVYGPVGSQAALVTVDGEPRPLTAAGTDSGHPVWRVTVPMDPGQKRQVDVALVAPVVAGDAGTRPVVQTQPMVHQPTVSTEPLAPCRSGADRSG